MIAQIEKHETYQLITEPYIEPKQGTVRLFAEAIRSVESLEYEEVESEVVDIVLSLS